ncbi:uncharacterized protein LOC127925588 [Oncorhynchus keta]|uniref:uncharacterized protein LOC127925588 n=1 Tax=Oncorhynchus keta TaxID=8018 RepID=UPI00227D40A3|nr:uncharacterized protein LOC127925588 [Oncorhynchus keta]
MYSLPDLRGGLATLSNPLDGLLDQSAWSSMMFSLPDLRGGLATLWAPLDGLLDQSAWSSMMFSLPDLRAALSESCSFSNNVFVLSMPKAAQPEEAARGSSSPPRDIIRPEAFVQTGPLLARRAQRDAPPPKVPKPPVAPRPKLLPSLGQGNVSLVSANAWDERTKKKRKKGVRVQRSSLGLRHIPRDVELAMMRPRLVKSAVPSQQPYQPWDDEDEVDIYALRRTAYMCPMYDQEESSVRGNKRVAVEALDNIPFRRKITLCYFMGVAGSCCQKTTNPTP